MDINELEFSKMTMKVLNLNGIKTLEELKEVIENGKLIALRGLGKKSFDEIMKKVMSEEQRYDQ